MILKITEELKGFIVFFSASYTPPGICRKMDKGNMAALHQAGMQHLQKEAARFLLENFPEIFLRMNLYHYVKK